MATTFAKDEYADLLRQFNKKFYKREVVTIDPSRDYTEEEWVTMIKKLPDGLRFPLPESWYEKYDITRPEPLSFPEALQNSFRVMFQDAPVEIRPVAEGGVRELPKAIVDETPQTDSESKPEEKVESSD